MSYWDKAHSITTKLNRDMTKPTKWACAQRWLKSAWASAKSWVFAVRMKKSWVLSYPLSAQRRLWSDWANAQADLSLRWVHPHFVGFVMSWLKLISISWCIIQVQHDIMRNVGTVCFYWYLKEILTIFYHFNLSIWFWAKMNGAQQNQQKDLFVWQRHRSAWASAQSDQSSLSAWRRVFTHPWRVQWRLESD